jgi:alkylhydroperoxidase family enzyme
MAFWAFADSWKALFHGGVCDHAIKELCRVYISRTVKCEFCGNQRSIKAAKAGLEEMQYDELLNFEGSERYDDRQKAALSYAEAIAWGMPGDEEAFWDRHFSDPELTELGCFIALTFGQQSWIRLLGIDHHQYLAGTDASLAPGFRTADELAETKAKADYWAKSPTA